MKSKVVQLVLVVSFVCLLVLGCDPSSRTLSEGESFSMRKIHGKVVFKEINEFESGNNKGSYYYCVGIEDRQGNIKTYQGVPKASFEDLEVGNVLPFDDPSQTEKTIGNNLDLSRINGAVSFKRIKYYQMGDTVGNPYYEIGIDVASSGIKELQIFKVVSKEDYDSVFEGMTLPVLPELTAQLMQKVKGTIVDRQANLSSRNWFVVVYDGVNIQAYRVAPEVYYQKLALGSSLPVGTKITNSLMQEDN